MKDKITRRRFFRTLASYSPLLLFPLETHASKKSELPGVLVIGDSISMGYTPYLTGILSEKANVWHPEENCEGTSKGVLKLDKWVGNMKWDIIHFNFGLHDLKHVNPVTGANSNKPEDPQQADIKQYAYNLEIIVDRLKATGAKLIFATTTPVPEKSSPYRNPSDVIEYNKAALRIMKKEKIEINDLYRYSLPLVPEIQIPNNVHFKPEGYRLLAERVSEYVIKSL